MTYLLQMEDQDPNDFVLENEEWDTMLALEKVIEEEDWPEAEALLLQLIK